MKHRLSNLEREILGRFLEGTPGCCCTAWAMNEILGGACKIRWATIEVVMLKLAERGYLISVRKSIAGYFSAAPCWTPCRMTAG